MGKLAYTVPECKKVRYIIHTDCKNEADDQYTVAHCLMTPLLDVKGIIAAHFDKSYGRYPDGATAQASYEEILRVLEAMDLIGEYPVKCGAPTAIPDEQTPIDSDGARFIIEEAMKDDPKPLFIGLQGAITDLASAILMEPKICDRMTAIWIGGGEYPKGGTEFNLSQDIAAANVVMKSSMPLWQVPSNIYKNFAVSLAELQCKVMPHGKLGKYLFDELTELNVNLAEMLPDFNWPHGELWGLGDEGVVAALMHEGQRTDLYHEINAPQFDYETMEYKLDTNNRRIRVYDKMDYRLTLEDLFCKLAIFAQ